MHIPPHRDRSRSRTLHRLLLPVLLALGVVGLEAAPFAPGNLVVYRVGTGAAARTSAATEVFLDEYTGAGTLVQSIALPTADDGANQIVTASGTATSEGMITRTEDGRFLVLTGYDAAPATASITSSNSTTVARVVARVGADASVDSSTTTTAFSANNIRAAVSEDGSAFWANGGNTGIVYLAHGGSGAGTVVSSSTTNTRVPAIFGGQLYISSGSGTNTFRGVNAVGTGLPVTTGQTTVRLPGMTDAEAGSVYGYLLADLDSGVAGYDTLYTADDAAGLGKWSLVGGNWIRNSLVGTNADDYRGLTGNVSGGTVTLYAVRDNGSSDDTLVSLIDATGYNAAMTATPAVLASAAANTAMRGVAFAPQPEVKLLITEAQSSQASSGKNDFWELTNVGADAVDLGTWKWDDDSRNPADAAAVTIPAGTTIAPGESIVFTGLAAATFRTWWNLDPSVQVISTGAAPGLGGSDAVALFDASGTERAFFSYVAGGFTKSDGSPSAGGHAGLSAGGSATASAIWDPVHGTTSPRYKAAVAGNTGAFVSTESSSDVGSPGYSGFTTGSVPSIDLTLSAVTTTFSESAANPASVGTVTRSGATTGALEVSLSSSDATEATVPATVTIPDGQASVDFDITAVNDSFPDGNKTVTITATATGSNPDTLDLTVQDDGDVLDTSFLLTEISSNQSAGSPVDAEDFWELTNISTVTKDISGYTWHDSGRSASTAQAWKLPSGTMIAPGESVIFTAAPPASFRTWWNLPPTVQVFQAAAAPGLGQNDGISFFDPQQNEIFFFSYAAGGFTKENGDPSTGTHAGPSAGGSADSQSLVWVPSSGTSAPRYTAATGSNLGTFSAVARATDLGSPGLGNVRTVSLSDNSVPEGNSGTSILALTVTRSDTATAFTVEYAVSGGTATAGTDYATLASGILTFTNGGSATQTINLSVNGDITAEPDETVVVTLSNVVNTSGDTLVGTANGTGTILNDDVIPPSLTLQVGGSTIATGGVTTLRVAAAGFPTPTLQWYRGNKGDISNPVGGATFPTLLTGPLAGTTNFWVRASNGSVDFDGDTITVNVVPPVTSVDLSNYVRIGRHSLPEPLLTPLPVGTPAHNLLCQEASGVAYNWDTDTLFVVADGGRSVTQVSKTGVLIDTMTLALGSSPQGTEFYDIEGVTYVGGGQFVMSEERDRQLVKFTYAAGTTLTRGQTQTVKIGTFVDNTGTEGLSYDPLTSGFVVLKEISPIGIFQTTVDFALGTASNGSASTVNSTDLFNPALLAMTDVADVFALSVLPSMTGHPQQPNLIVLSQEDGKLVNIDRSGVISSTRQLFSDPGNPLSVAGQQHEGVTMDAAGFLYIVNENGGGGIDFPELWVYAPATAPNAAPTGLSLNGAVTSVIENTSTASALRLGEVVVVDDGLGTNVLGLAGADAAFFELVGNTLFLKAGTVLDFETKSSYQVTLQVDDASLGTDPDATQPFTLTVTDQDPETPPPPALLITEVAPWSSGNSAVGADWFEVTNISASAVDISGWKIDDSSKAFGSAVALSGITSIAPGESVIFIETSDLAGKAALFRSHWFGASPPAALQIGNYTGSGIGLGTSGDAVWLFDSVGQVRAGVTFAASPSAAPFGTFDNTAGLNGVAVSKLSVAGVNGALPASGTMDEIGSPGFAAPGLLRITEVAPWSSGNSPVGADWFEVTNVGARVVSLEGWKMDDSSESPVGAVALNGIAAIAPGESVIFLETETVATTVAAFRSNWFGANPPAGLQVGTYSGSGVGLSTGGDAVNLFDSANVRQAKVTFGASPTAAPFGTFDNSALIDNAALTLYSAAGVNGAFAAVNSVVEIGSPGVINKAPEVGGAILTQSATGGTPFSLQFPAGTFVDPEGQALTYSATRGDGNPLPAWLSFDPGTRTFSGTPGAGDGGALVVKLIATDGGTPGLQTVITFTIQVTAQLAPPALLTGPSTTVAPYLTSHLPGVAIQSLLTVGDGQTVPKAGGGTTRLVGIGDGLGAYDNGDGTFTMLLNHEITNTQGITRAHGSVGSFVSKWTIDKATRQVVSGDDLIKQVFTWNGSAFVSSGSPFAFDRLCSADLPAQTALFNGASGNGSSARIYMNGEETSGGRAFAHVVDGPDAGKSYHLAHFGFTNFENVVLSPKAQDKTIAIMTNDSGDGEVFVYIGTKNSTGTTEPEKAGLTGGTLYGMAVPGKPFELAVDASLAVGPTETFTLASIGGPGNYPTGGTDTNNRATTAGVLQLGGPEDGVWDTRPGFEDTFYFVTKGTSSNGINAPTRLWKMEFTDISQPENGGVLSILLDGPALRLGSLDNMTFDDGKLLIQEDLGDDERLSAIWEYDVTTGELQEVAEHRGNYFYTGGANFLTINEESSGIIPLRSILGAGWYAAAIQVHTSSHIPAGDRTELVEGGQLVLLDLGNRESDLVRSPLVQHGDTWRYDATGTDPGATWKNVGFADGGWSSGPSMLGYGDDLETQTDIPAPGTPTTRPAATYYRTTFDVANPADTILLDLYMKWDDGAVVYINGVEVARPNMSRTAAVTHTTFATVNDPAERDWKPVSIPCENLNLQATGNVLAISIHQENASSSDTRIDAELFAWSKSPDPGAAPALPTGLAVSNPTNESLDLDWNAQSDAKFFVIERQKAGELTWQVVDGDVPGTFTSYTDLALSGGSDYSYRIWAVNQYGASACTAPQTGTTTNVIVPTIFFEDFSTTTNSSATGTFTTETGIRIQSLAAGRNWYVAGPFGSIGKVANGNGFGSTPAGEGSDEWMFLPPLNTDFYSGELFSFLSDARFNDTGLAGLPAGTVPTASTGLDVLISTNYDPAIHTDPRTASWTLLNPQAAFDTDFSGFGSGVASGDIDLTSLQGIATVAFRYRSSGTVSNAARHWEVTDLQVLGSAGIDFEISTGLAPFTQISSASSLNWSVATMSALAGARANNFGADAPGDDWLISPAFASVFDDMSVSFDYYERFADLGVIPQGKPLAVLVSTNYDPAIHTNPSSATWTDITPAGLDGSVSNAWKTLNNVPLGLSGTNWNVHVAFRYQSSGTGSNGTKQVGIDKVAVGRGGGPLGVDFNFTQTGNESTFTPSITGGTEPYTVSWDFGDTGSATGESPSHIFANNGSYTVTVTVTDAAGASTTATKNVVTNFTEFAIPAKAADLRVATFNTAMNSDDINGNAGDANAVANALASGTHPSIKKVAEVIQRLNPDVVLLNEVDLAYTGQTFDAAGTLTRVDNFRTKYLGVAQAGDTAAVTYPYHYIGGTNTGLSSGYDLRNQGGVDTTPGDQGYGDDSFGFGQFPGKYGFVVLSKYPIDTANARTFQKFLWKDMPGALLPEDPADTDGNSSTASFYSPDELNVFRLSSKSHWDVPVIVGGQTVHLLCSHPTPPVFDDGETLTHGVATGTPATKADWNGLRNNDEIRFWADYIDPTKDDYIYDDSEVTVTGTDAAGNQLYTGVPTKQGLGAGESFVIVGDLNADPVDGDSSFAGVTSLTTSAFVDTSITPESTGSLEQVPGSFSNRAQKTSSFNLRADYALPSVAGLDLVQAGVHWPKLGDATSYLLAASDHRSVWVDLDLDGQITIDPIITGGSGGSVTGGGVYAPGSTATFTAVPATGYRFVGWTVNGAPAGTGNPLSVTASAGLQVEATFAYVLQLLHFADGEAGLLASQTAPNLAALVDAFDDDYANTIILAGGDNYIPGPFAAAGTDAIVAATHNKGNNPFAADIEIHNRIGVQASTVGNHEFDFGTAAFSDAINDTTFPYLSANLDFSGDSAISARYQETVGTGGLEEASTLAKKVVPSAVITVNGEKIGLVGATTQIIETISSTGGVEVKGFAGDGSETNNMALLASQLQPVIDDLTGQGVNKIVLMAHLQQITLEQSLAPLLTGVDIVLAAGSNTRLGDADDVAVPFTGHAADFAGGYPIVTAGADSKPVLIVNTDNEFTYLGRLVVDFDGNGEIVTSGLPDRVPENGAYAATAANVAAAWGVSEANLATTAFAVGTKGAGVKQITDAVQSVIAAKDGDVKGYTNHYLEGERAFVRNQETNLGNLSADANAFVLAEAAGETIPIVSLKNGGGIRAAIGAVDVVSGAKNPPLANPSAGKAAGGVSLLDIENSMRFNNRLLAFDTTPAGLKAILEHGVAVLGGQGRFPQIGGVSFAYDPARPAGDRITTMSLIGEEGQLHDALYDGEFSAWAPPVIRLVTLNFLANGGDGYPMKANGTNFRYLLDDGTLGPVIDPALDFTIAPSLPANALGEQKALADFLAGRHATPATAYDVADTAPADDLRIQNLSVRSDEVPFDLTLLLGGGGVGSIGNETIESGERQGIRFTLTETRRVEIAGTGSTALTAELLDENGNVVEMFTGPGSLLIGGILPAGDYLLRVSNDTAGEETVSIEVDASGVPSSRPDAAVGKSVTSLTGVGNYGPVSAQEFFALSRKLKPVKAVSTIANRGDLDDNLRVRGTQGDRDFEVTYRRAGRNITAEMVAGRFKTGEIGSHDAPVVIQTTITPNKSTLTKVVKKPTRRPGSSSANRGGVNVVAMASGERTRILSRTFAAQITATSTVEPTLSDAVQIRVTTR